jgi:hypothetical protein
MPKKPKANTMSFEQLVWDSYSELKSCYDDAMKLHPDRNESSRRSEGKEACFNLLQHKYILPNSSDERSNTVLTGLRRRYEDFLLRHYAAGEYRVTEWYNLDWKPYLKEEHHVGDSEFDQSRLDAEVLRAAELTLPDVMEILSFEIAYQVILDKHIAALNTRAEDTDDSEPIEDQRVDKNERRAGAFDSFQCTAFIVTLIDALTRHTYDLRQGSEDNTCRGNIYNLNMKKLSVAISLVSGRNVDNIRHDIGKWRAKEIVCSDNRLHEVRQALLSFGVTVDTTILDEAISKKEG